MNLPLAHHKSNMIDNIIQISNLSKIKWKWNVVRFEFKTFDVLRFLGSESRVQIPSIVAHFDTMLRINSMSGIFPLTKLVFRQAQ